MRDLVTDPRRQRQILIAMCAALIAVVASVSGLNVAQQDLALDLGASQGQLLWVINGYTMALAALLLPIGAIGDRWGRKPVLVSGLVLFSLANVMAGLATDDRHAADRSDRGRGGGGDDHAGHAVGHHVELPARAARPCGRGVDRFRRCRWDPRALRIVFLDRLLHVAVAVRDARPVRRCLARAHAAGGRQLA